jgi:phage tail-like protein
VNETKYFIFNREEAFEQCKLHGFEIKGNAVVLETAAEGVLITPILDCLERGNVWQRLFIEINLPENAETKYRFYAANTEDEAKRLHKELTDEKTLTSAFIKNNSTDFLLQNVKGRYCILAMEITKPKNSPPAVLTSIQIYSAWESFLQYLPEIYRTQNEFLDRFLKLFSAPYLELEQKIDCMAEIFDPRTAPTYMLKYLAEIMGIPHSGLWETENLRKLLITGLYRKKGRMYALADFVELFCGFRPYITENFRMLTGETENDRHYNNGEVNIYLPCGAMERDLNINALRIILQSFMPCGVTYNLRILNPKIVLSDGAYLGINTYLSEYDTASLGMNSRLNLTILEEKQNGKQQPVSVNPQ